MNKRMHMISSNCLQHFTCTFPYRSVQWYFQASLKVTGSVRLLWFDHKCAVCVVYSMLMFACALIKSPTYSSLWWRLLFGDNLKYFVYVVFGYDRLTLLVAVYLMSCCNTSCRTITKICMSFFLFYIFILFTESVYFKHCIYVCMHPAFNKATLL